jgi:SAM-dependent methyltransferase
MRALPPDIAVKKRVNSDSVGREFALAGIRPEFTAITLDWSSYADAYDRVLCRTATYQALLTDLLGRTGPLPPLRDGTVVLDCGCGTGNLCLSILDQLPAATLLAVDNDATMAQHFRRKLADRLSPLPMPGRVCFLEADLMAVFPWLKGHNVRPDYVFLANVLYLADDPAATLRAIAGCLRPGGELRLSNPDERTDIDVLFRQLERDLADVQQLDELSDDFAVLGVFNRQRLSSMLRRLSGAEIRQLVLDTGFQRITHVTHDHYAGQSLLLSART